MRCYWHDKPSKQPIPTPTCDTQFNRNIYHALHSSPLPDEGRGKTLHSVSILGLGSGLPFIDLPIHQSRILTLNSELPLHHPHHLREANPHDESCTPTPSTTSSSAPTFLITKPQCPPIHPPPPSPPKIHLFNNPYYPTNITTPKARPEPHPPPTRPPTGPPAPTRAPPTKRPHWHNKKGRLPQLKPDPHRPQRPRTKPGEAAIPNEGAGEALLPRFQPSVCGG